MDSSTAMKDCPVCGILAAPPSAPPGAAAFGGGLCRRAEAVRLYRAYWPNGHITRSLGHTSAALATGTRWPNVHRLTRWRTLRAARRSSTALPCMLSPPPAPPPCSPHAAARMKAFRDIPGPKCASAVWPCKHGAAESDSPHNQRPGIRTLARP